MFVPYCSADFFLGDETTTHGGADGVAARTIEHRGANTLRRALDLVVGRYGDLEQLVVAGTSAGAVPTPLVAALASDALPHADIAVLADGAGGYLLQGQIGGTGLLMLEQDDSKEAFLGESLVIIANRGSE